MARPNKYWQERLNKAREKAMEQMFDLHKDAAEHIRASIISVSVCTYCDSTFRAPKSDAEGKCLRCHGMGVVADKDQRNWAAEQITSRTLPKPKQVEATIDDISAPSEATEKLESMSDEALRKVAAVLDDALGGKGDGQSGEQSK